MDPSAFIDPAAIGIVFGGTLLAAALRTPAGDLARAGRAAATLARRPFSAAAAEAQLAALARIARRHGVMALDRSVVADPTLAVGVAAIVDGASPGEVAERLADARRSRSRRHAAAADVWAAAAETAPAMGMVGTLIGLARMFADMDSSAAIGSGMAVALLATLYGAVAANLLFMPVAARLRAAHLVENAERRRLEAPIVRLAERERPRRPLQSVA